MTAKITSCLVASLFSVLASSTTLLADTSPTLERIAQRQTITIGHRESEVPFSYLVDGQPVGYAIDLCLAVVERISEQLEGPPPRVEFVPVTPVNRFILLRNGEIDLECGVTTSTSERRQQAAFSYPHFLTATHYVALAENDINTVADLAGRSVVSTTGTINVEQLNELNRTQGLNIAVMLSRSHEEAFSMVANEQAAAFVMDDILLASLVSAAALPQRFHISEETISEPKPYGLMMPLEDAVFAEMVNEALYEHYHSGAIQALYDKWFLKPIPPGNRVIGLPVSSELAAIFERPDAYAH